MGWGDWIFVLGCLSVSGGTALYTYRRHFKERRKAIPYTIQSEIDQTPEWWDNEFRRLQGLPTHEHERLAQAGITEVWDGDLLFSLRHLVDIKPPTVSELWTPSAGDSYDISVDLADIASATQKVIQKGE